MPIPCTRNGFIFCHFSLHSRNRRKSGKEKGEEEEYKLARVGQV